MLELEPAIFSPDRMYRYLLRRRVGFGDNVCLFIMLNPSTADEYVDDPTIRRCIGFAIKWGYGILEVVNLFALRATDPRELRSIFSHSPVGPENDTYILEAARRAFLVVAAWGNWGAFMNRGGQVFEMLQRGGIDVTRFGLTNQGEPKHPLYIPAAALPA